MVTAWKKYKAMRKLLLDAYRRGGLSGAEWQLRRKLYAAAVRQEAETKCMDASASGSAWRRCC